MDGQAATSDAQHDRLRSIDALRGWAILAVFVAHAGYMADLEGGLRRVTDFSSLGVQLFFIVSGFTIFLTLDRSPIEGRFARFYVRRLMRIVPVYWFGIVLYTAVYGTGWRGWQGAPEIWHYPLHLTLTNLLHPTAMSSVVPGGWSISCEVLFYLTVPLWFVLVRTWRSAAVLLLASLLAGPLLIAFMRPMLDPVFPPGADLEQYWYRSYFNQLPFFAFGILLVRLRGTPLAAALGTGVVNSLVLGAATLALLRAFSIGDHHLAGVALTLVGAALLERPREFFVNRLFVGLGRISYSAYLFHFLVLEKVDDAFALPFVGLLLVASPITVGLAWCGYTFLEQPASGMAGRLIDGRRPARYRAGAILRSLAAAPQWALRTKTVPAE